MGELGELKVLLEHCEQGETMRLNEVKACLLVVFSCWMGELADSAYK